jgi:hypothetical protein
VHIAALHARRRKQLERRKPVHQPLDPAGFVLDDVQQLRLLRETLPLEQLRGADDARQRVLHFVAEDAAEPGGARDAFRRIPRRRFAEHQDEVAPVHTAHAHVADRPHRDGRAGHRRRWRGDLGRLARGPVDQLKQR